MKLGLMEVSADALVEILRLPKGTRIIDMRSTKFDRCVSSSGPSLELIIESDGLKEIQEGAPVPRVSPMYKGVYNPQFVEWL